MSAAWQPLPEALPTEVRHFVEQLRLLKDRTGLSLIALGKETAYSKSSWQRYLNAQQPPPRQAVAALCRVAGVDCERFCAHWELAVRVWPRGGSGGAGRAESTPGVVLSKLSKTGDGVGDGVKGGVKGGVRRARPKVHRTGRSGPARVRSVAGVTVFLVLMVLLEGLLRFLAR
ncbi:helix-turn-helix domain-containing protein [Streptomyces sp. NPDC048441]|uniref:helix-turn-helix domain-containing protein n=1 Tax=Streptomyces sp. NPDC048441 TaxID=3365552 RepID=UPI003723F3F6